MSYLTSGGARRAALAVLVAAATVVTGGVTAWPALADTTVTVTTTTDENTPGDGACSLREALLYAQGLNGSNTDCGTTPAGKTTISVPAGRYAFAPHVGAAQIEIRPGGSSSIVIAGAGTGTTATTGTIIDGQGKTPRLLLVDAGARVTIQNLTLTGGTELEIAGDGGGIANLGTLMLNNAVVTGNATNAGGCCGPGVPVFGRGGGIFNSGALTLLESKVYGNATAGGGNGFIPTRTCGGTGLDGGSGTDGGGIYTQGGYVTVISTTIADNGTGPGGDGAKGLSASAIPGCIRGGNGSSAGHGGDGGGIFNNGGIVVVRESAVYGNTTGRGGTGGDGGPGSAQGGWGGDGGRGGDGAGIASNGMLTVINTTNTDNGTGNGGPGGLAGAGSVTPGQPGLDGSGGSGGGIFQQNGQAVVQESTVAANVTGTGAGPQGTTFGKGGGDGITVISGELTEVDTIVSHDECLTGPSGQIKDGYAAGDGHVNLSFPTASCPGIVADPLLGPLDYSAPTPVLPIAPPSAAIDRVPATAAAGCTPTDQRGVLRPQPAGGRCDIGAYEYKP